ncbi:Hypothetical_protein [Hexamita inflata]|uniref:Hypothetical_protein n=1 Tax=Hexamita inflata TaxID=28002 RepID=A0ABP1HGN7_9EUKA
MVSAHTCSRARQKGQCDNRVLYSIAEVGASRDSKRETLNTYKSKILIILQLLNYNIIIKLNVVANSTCKIKAHKRNVELSQYPAEPKPASATQLLKSKHKQASQDAIGKMLIRKNIRSKYAAIWKRLLTFTLKITQSRQLVIFNPTQYQSQRRSLNVNSSTDPNARYSYRKLKACKKSRTLKMF